MEGAWATESPLGGEQPKMAAQPTLDCVKPLSLGDLSLWHGLAYPEQHN